jgi:hypothetical protein
MESDPATVRLNRLAVLNVGLEGGSPLWLAAGLVAPLLGMIRHIPPSRWTGSLASRLPPDIDISSTHGEYRY